MLPYLLTYLIAGVVVWGIDVRRGAIKRDHQWRALPAWLIAGWWLVLLAQALGWLHGRLERLR